MKSQPHKWVTVAVQYHKARHIDRKDYDHDIPQGKSYYFSKQANFNSLPLLRE